MTPHSEMLETPLSLPYQHRYFDEPTLGDGYDVLYGTAVHAGDPTTRTVPSPAAEASGVSWRCSEVVDEPAIIVSVPWVRHVWHLLFDLVQPLFNMVRRTYGADEAERFFFGGAATDKSEQRDVRIWLYHRQERDSDFLPEETAEVEEGSGGGKTKYLHIERELQLAEARDRPTRVLRLLSRLPFGTKEDLDGRGLVCFRDLHVGLDPRGTPFAFGVQQRDPSEATLRPADLAAAAVTSPVGKMVEEQVAFKRFLERGLGLLFWERRGAATGAAAGTTTTSAGDGGGGGEEERAARLFGELDGLTPDEEEAREEELRAERLFGAPEEPPQESTATTTAAATDEGEWTDAESARAQRLFGDFDESEEGAEEEEEEEEEKEKPNAEEEGAEAPTASEEQKEKGREEQQEPRDERARATPTTLREEHITVIRRTGGDGVRSLKNHGELIATLGTMARETSNFATVGARATVQEAVLETMTFGRQLVLFRDTTVLFGVHGQALSNAVFLRDGAVLVLLNEPGKFGLKWMFANLALTSRVHVVAIRRPEDDPCDDGRGWGGLKDHVTFNRNMKNGTTLSAELFSLAITKAMELRGLPFDNTSTPSFHIVPEDRCILTETEPTKKQQEPDL